VNIARDYPGVDTPNPDPILQGPFGKGTTSNIDNGTTETIKPTDNPNVVGVIYTTGSSNTGTTNVFIARSTYGSGRVIATGDSSSIDDGTCESGNTCYDGWGDPQTQNSILYPNGTEWLASGQTATPTPTASVTPVN
ncbi:MAG: hydrolase, partial [Chloroflexota bacterium]|nr:hydrolase [Chloroflexota bacterium]